MKDRCLGTQLSASYVNIRCLNSWASWGCLRQLCLRLSWSSPRTLCPDTGCPHWRRMRSWSGSPLSRGSRAQPVPFGVGLVWPCRGTWATISRCTLALRCILGSICNYWAIMAKIWGIVIGLLERFLAWDSPVIPWIDPTLHIIGTMLLPAYVACGLCRLFHCGWVELVCGILCTQGGVVGQHPWRDPSLCEGRVFREPQCDHHTPPEDQPDTGHEVMKTCKGPPGQLRGFINLLKRYRVLTSGARMFWETKPLLFWTSPDAIVWWGKTVSEWVTASAMKKNGGEEGLRAWCRVVREGLSATRTWGRHLNPTAEWIPGGGMFQTEGTTVAQELRGEPSVIVWLEPRPVWDKSLPHGELSHTWESAKAQSQPLVVLPKMWDVCTAVILGGSFKMILDGSESHGERVISFFFLFQWWWHAGESLPLL